MYAQPTAAVVSGPQGTAVFAQQGALASQPQLSLAQSLGVPQELATCITPPRQMSVEHKNYTLNSQNTNRQWLTKDVSYVPQTETVSATTIQHPDINITQPCPVAAAPCDPPVVAAPAPCAQAVVAAAPSCNCCWTTGSIPSGGSQISGIGAGYGATYLGVGTVGGAVLGGPQVAYGPTLYRAF